MAALAVGIRSASAVEALDDVVARNKASATA